MPAVLMDDDSGVERAEHLEVGHVREARDVGDRREEVAGEAAEQRERGGDVDRNRPHAAIRVV